MKKEIDPQYKANREKMTRTDFWDQIRELKIILALWGIDQYYSTDMEADDVAFQLVKENRGKKILLVSSDHDWYQLMTKTIMIYQDSKIHTLADIEDALGHTVQELSLFKSIAGETGDNIKGIKMIRKELVWASVRGCENLADLIDKCHRDGDRGANAKILDNIELVKNNYRLVKMSPCELEEIEPSKNWVKFKQKLESYEMNKLLERFSHA